METKWKKVNFINVKTLCETYGLGFYDDTFQCLVVDDEKSAKLLGLSPNFLYQIKAFDDFVFVDYELRKALIEAAIKDYENAKRGLEDD